MGLSVPLPDKDGPRRGSKAAPVQLGESSRNVRGPVLLPGNLLQDLHGPSVQVTEAIGLNFIGDDPKQKIACKIARNTDPLRGDFASNSDPS
jgi:hypothetical protein